MIADQVGPSLASRIASRIMMVSNLCQSVEKNVINRHVIDRVSLGKFFMFIRFIWFICRRTRNDRVICYFFSVMSVLLLMIVGHTHMLSEITLLFRSRNTHSPCPREKRE